MVEVRLQLEPLDGRQVVIESARDITERKQWEHRQQLLLGELAHRVKNTLALVHAIAHQTMRTSASNKDFVDRFEARLLALARAHGLLIESDWNGADLRALVRPARTLCFG
jgi:two-component system, chemotaxis family, CheB/CheR fusion protein